jgi:hypothetical protein
MGDPQVIALATVGFTSSRTLNQQPVLFGRGREAGPTDRPDGRRGWPD